MALITSDIVMQCAPRTSNGPNHLGFCVQVRERWKDLHIAFKHQATTQPDGSRALSPDKVMKDPQ